LAAFVERAFAVAAVAAAARDGQLDERVLAESLRRLIPPPPPFGMPAPPPSKKEEKK
jgi:hypothetical protein